MSLFPLLQAHELDDSPSCQTAQAAPASGHSALIWATHPLRTTGASAARLPRLTAQGEKRVRAVYGALILRAARLLDLPAVAGATAAVYWHRFYSKESLLLHHPSVCASAALFLASKIEECSRRVRDVINVVYRCQHSNPQANNRTQQQQQQQQSHEASPNRQIHAAYASPLHPSSAAHAAAAAASSAAAAAASSSAASSSSTALAIATDGDSLQVSPLFWELKEEVVRFEQKLLRVLGFECRIKHPLAFVLHLAREMECSEEVVRIASYMANDSARTTLCLQYAPHATACACIYLAAEMAQEQIRFHPAIIQTHNTTAADARAAANSNASPYRSPHHSNAASSSAAAAAPSAPSSTVVLHPPTTSHHSSEWWEYFGGVNQLEIEDIVHQLLDLFETNEGGAAYDSADSGYYHTPHLELARIADDVARELKQQTALELARNQRIEASLRESTSINSSNNSSSGSYNSSTAMTDDDPRSKPTPSQQQQHQPRTLYAASSPAVNDAFSAASTAAAAPGSAGKVPHRLSFPPPPAPSTPSAPRTITASSASSAAASSAYPSYAASSSAVLPPSAYASYTPMGYTPAAPFGTVAALRNASAAAAQTATSAKR